MQECLPPSSLRSWDQFSKLTPEEIKKAFSVSLIYSEYVDREYINSGGRIAFTLNAAGLQASNQKSKFAEEEVVIDLTEEVNDFLEKIFPAGLHYKTYRVSPS